MSNTIFYESVQDLERARPASAPVYVASFSDSEPAKPFGTYIYFNVTATYLVDNTVHACYLRVGRVAIVGNDGRDKADRLAEEAAGVADDLYAFFEARNAAVRRGLVAWPKDVRPLQGEFDKEP